MTKGKLNDSWVVSYKEMKRYKDIIKGLRQQSKETEKKLKKLQSIIIDIEDKLDLLNGEYGCLCLFCDSKIYNAQEGIVHKSYCLIKKLRNGIKRFKEYFKDSDK